MTKSVLVSAPTRLHITLCDLGRATARAYGGIGFAIRKPSVSVRIAAGSGHRRVPTELDKAACEALREVIDRLQTLSSGAEFDVTVEQVPPQHTGLGTKTAVLLSTILGANALLDLNLSVNCIQSLSGRGGTSGIGIHSFFSGGFIWDAGHPQGDIERLGPSRFHRPLATPLCINRLDFPEEWAVCILHAEGARPSGQQELDLFARGTPVPSNETHKLMSCITHGFIPGLIERDLTSVGISLRQISETGFKAREIQEQSPTVRLLLSELQQRGIPAGMSSLGPTIFAIIHNADHSRQELIEKIAEKHGASWDWTLGDNRGARLSLAS